MDAESLKESIGKKCKLVLKNNFSYTIIIPEFEGTTISAVDKFGNVIRIDIGSIATIIELK